jgi:hypothetical protein
VHPMRGALFENMLMNEYLKHCRNRGGGAQMHFWRDHIGNEVDGVALAHWRDALAGL